MILCTWVLHLRGCGLMMLMLLTIVMMIVMMMVMMLMSGDHDEDVADDEYGGHDVEDGDRYIS